jgi:hypothetical protein
MTDYSSRAAGGSPTGNSGSDRPNDTFSAASSLAQESVAAAKRVGSDAVATLSSELKELLNGQVRAGAHKLRHVARAARRAAEDLEQEAPFAAGLVRSVASSTDRYAQILREQSVEDIWFAGTAFTRRQPALVFGLAALAGFFAIRIVRSTEPVSSPSIQPSEQYRSSSGNLYGS